MLQFRLLTKKVPPRPYYMNLTTFLCKSRARSGYISRLLLLLKLMQSLMPNFLLIYFLLIRTSYVPPYTIIAIYIGEISKKVRSIKENIHKAWGTSRQTNKGMRKNIFIPATIVCFSPFSNQIFKQAGTFVQLLTSIQ